MAGGITSLYTAISGMNSAQAGLYVIGHNMSNSQIQGYSRQRVMQHDFSYTTIGSNNNGNLSVGLGTDITSIKQVRNLFYDISYRQEATKLNFHTPMYETGVKIQDILGELDSEYKSQTTINDLWDALNELSEYPQGIETRGTFISTAKVCLDKMKNSFDRMIAEQRNLDNEIRSSIKLGNDLLASIKDLNTKIVQAEYSGDNANDLRDERNNYLDQLSSLMDIEIRESADGNVNITTGGNELLVNGRINKMGLRYTDDKYGFVEPVFTNSKEILPSSEVQYRQVVSTNMVADLSATKDKGKLNGLLYARGYTPADYTTNPTPPDATDIAKYPLGIADPAYKNDYTIYKRDVFSVENCTIPMAMKEMDNLFHEIVLLVNDKIGPMANPTVYDSDGNPCVTEVFSRIKIGANVLPTDYPYPIAGTNPQEYTTFPTVGNDGVTPDYANYVPEDPADYYTLYTIQNIEINPIFKDSNGYSKLSLSRRSDPNDPNSSIDNENSEAVKELVTKWKSNYITYGNSENMSIDGTYRNFVDKIAVKTNEEQGYFDAQTGIVNSLDNKRRETSGVSLDEEMSQMLIYQHAYESSSRIFNVIDSMLDKLINGTGRVGL